MENNNKKTINSSEPQARYSLRTSTLNKRQEYQSTAKPTTKRKSTNKQTSSRKKTKTSDKMDLKGKQKAVEEDKAISTEKLSDKKQDDTSLDNYNNDAEEADEEDYDDEEEMHHWDEDEDTKQASSSLHDHEEDDDEEEEDEDEDDEDDELARVRRTLGLQMQGLFGGAGMSSDSSRFRSILNSLKESDDPTMQLIALQELAEILSVSSEDNLAGYFSSDSFSKELVRIMKGPDMPMTSEDMDEDMMLALAMSEGFEGGNPEVMLLACRCISNLLEAMPTAVTSVVFHGAIRVLCQKLKSIQYIDLAEQALYALEKIAAQLPRAVVHEGGLSAALMYFDFFSIHAQRIALRTAANCLRGIDQDSFAQVTEITPILMNTISYSDRSVVELTCLCWVRISESYRSNRENLEHVINVDLLKILFGLIPISGNPNAVHPGTFQDLLRIFRSISKASPQLSVELLKLGIIDSFYQILTGMPVSFSDKTVVHITLDTKWRDSVPHIMKIIVDLLPPLPKDDMFSSRRFKDRTTTTSATIVETADPRIEWFQQDKTVLYKLDTILIPLVLDMYASTVNLRVRQLVTHTLVKLIHYSDAETLQKVLANMSLSSFLSGILTRQEHPSLISDALFQTELLIKKLPQVYHFLFEREGVLHEIENISKLPMVAEEDRKKEAAIATTANANNVTANAAAEESDTTTDAEKKDEEEDEDEKKSTTEEESSSRINRRLFDHTDLQALLRSRYDLMQQQQQQKLHNHDTEKGIGRGSTRKYIIQLAQHFVKHYANKGDKLKGYSLKGILQFTNDILNNEDTGTTLRKLSNYLNDSVMGISSFELINSGLMKTLLAYLTQKEGFKQSLEERKTLFQKIFVDQPDIDQDGNNALKKLVVRLQEILSRSETFEVVTPLESSSNESLRNPTSMLAKQLRLRLTGNGQDIPPTYKQLMVSTHAVATFRVLEEYLLAKVSSSSSAMHDDEDEDEEEQHVLIDEEDEMEIDQEQPDTEMNETVVVKTSSNDEEGEDEESEEVSSPEKEEDISSSSKPTTSSSANNKKEKKDGEWKIRFLLNGTVISNDSTVYAAVHQFEQNPDNERQVVGRNTWSSSYPVAYERVWVAHSTEEKEIKPTAPVRQIANVSQPKELQDDSTCSQVLHLLEALSFAIEKHPQGITAQDFINRKLTAKMNRQLEEPLIVASACLPTWVYWLMSVAPFLFPFETRYLFIQSTSFGYSRLIARWQSQMRNNTQNGPRNNDDQQPMLGRMERQKVRIMRTQMLESAIKILDLFGSSPTVLEIEYMGEEGTGMGPTLEFYASTSKEFSKHSLNMWRGSEKKKEGYVDNVLFPKSLAKSSSRSTKKIVHLFKTLGKFIAKGMLDFRIIDIPFSFAFFKVVLLDQVETTPELVVEVDPSLDKSVKMLQSFIQQKRDIYADTKMTSVQKTKAVQAIEVDGAKLQDLCLDFTLPGDESYELKAGGSDINVTIHNVEEYLELLCDAIVGSGIEQQIAAFREGFNCLFAIDDLKLLTYTELVSLFGKSSEDWSYATLTDTIRADHGFTMDSEPIKHLLDILSNFSDEEKRQFLQFTTGSPRLPIGGWKALRPIFTVVRKIPEEPLKADDYLPSVMTCANYFKMPAYTTKDIMLNRLLISMKEGQQSFLLS